MVLFFCSFLALRSEDTIRPSKNIQDYAIHGEHELFAG